MWVPSGIHQNKILSRLTENKMLRCVGYRVLASILSVHPHSHVSDDSKRVVSQTLLRFPCALGFHGEYGAKCGRADLPDVENVFLQKITRYDSIRNSDNITDINKCRSGRSNLTNANVQGFEYLRI